MKYYNISVNGVAYSVSVEETAAGAAPVAPAAAPAPKAAPAPAAAAAPAAPAAPASAGAADMTCEAANARASVVAAFELLSTKRAARLPKKHGNMAL